MKQINELYVPWFKLSEQDPPRKLDQTWNEMGECCTYTASANRPYWKTAACLFVPTSGWQHVKTIERWWKMNQNLRCSNCSFTLSQNWQETQQAADYKFSDVACVAVAAFSCMAGIAVSGFSWTASVLHHRRVLLFHPWCLSSILVYLQSPETPNHSITVIYIFDFIDWLLKDCVPSRLEPHSPPYPHTHSSDIARACRRWTCWCAAGSLPETCSSRLCDLWKTWITSKGAETVLRGTGSMLQDVTSWILSQEGLDLHAAMQRIGMINEEAPELRCLETVDHFTVWAF